MAKYTIILCIQLLFAVVCFDKLCLCENIQQSYLETSTSESKQDAEMHSGVEENLHLTKGNDLAESLGISQKESVVQQRRIKRRSKKKSHNKRKIGPIKEERAERQTLWDDTSVVCSNSQQKIQKRKPSAHIVPNPAGSVQGGYDDKGNIISEWKVVSNTGMKIDSIGGRIVIGKPGFYFIYSQIFFNKNTSNPMTHCIRIGDKTKFYYFICGTKGSNYHTYGEDNQHFQNENTNYIGGTLCLQKGATVSMGIRPGDGDTGSHDALTLHGSYSFLGLYMY